MYFINIWNYDTDCTEHCRSPVKFETSITVTPNSFSLQAIQHQIINILEIRSYHEYCGFFAKQEDLVHTSEVDSPNMEEH